MTGILRMAALLALAVLLLAACGAPAYISEGEHGVSDNGHAAVEGQESTSGSGETAGADAPAATDADSGGHMHPAVGSAQPAELPVPLGDPGRGAELFNTMFSEVGFACATCHRVDSEEQLVGPGLLNVASHAAGHVPGLSVEEYLYQSITDPGAYVVPGFPDNLMPRTYRELFTDEQIGDLMAYLLSLSG